MSIKNHIAAHQNKLYSNSRLPLDLREKLSDLMGRKCKITDFPSLPTDIQERIFESVGQFTAQALRRLIH